jgi:hypothetical protein
MTTQMKALEAVSFRPHYTAADIWRDDVIHVDGIHKEPFNEVRRIFRLMKEGVPYSNIVVEGASGTGKSHFLGRIRRGVTKGENVFVLIQLSSARQFWHSVAIAYADALFREGPTGRTQLEFVLDALADQLGLGAEDKAALLEGQVSLPLLKKVHHGLKQAFGRSPGMRPVIVTGLALCLLNSSSPVYQDTANAIIQGLEAPEESTGQLDLTRLPPREVVKGFDRIFMLAGKCTLVAIDQLDGLIAMSRSSNQAEAQSVLDEVANGLMDLAEDNPEHTLIILSCLPPTWTLIRERGVQSAWQRFSNRQQLRFIPNAEVGEALIASYLAAAYKRVNFKPPYPTWPIRKSAFAEAPLYSPRGLIQLTEQHIRSCREKGVISELADFGAAQDAPAADEVKPEKSDTLNALFEQLHRQADISHVLEKDNVDKRLPPLLRAGLEAWILEQDHPTRFSLDAPPGRNPALHARLRQILDADLEDEVHWSFRAVPHVNPTAALTRLRSAVTTSGLGARRSLFIIRNAKWSTGAVTREVVSEFEAKGGLTVLLSDDDLRTFAALLVLLAEKPEGLSGWLRDARPASRTHLLARMQPEPLNASSARNDPRSAAPGGTEKHSSSEPSYSVADDEIPLGRSEETAKPVSVKLEDLRRHVAIFAGSGSGKTVLIRRLIEECALRGVSSIVLDPNNDLARLGTPWPEPPGGWFDGDAERARQYHESVDVAIWTPKLSAGRPIAFAPLADLGAVANDPDEFEIALDNTVATLLPRAGLPAIGAKRAQGQAVLKQALRGFIRGGGEGFRSFLDYLHALPEGTSPLSNAEKLAAGMADTLYAATVNDPLFGGTGTSVDPATLLTPPAGKRARVSVISLTGLPAEEQRQSFVSQLQMALFAWVKKNPAGNRPLGGLFVMDEAQTFAPSASSTPCLASTLALASQARKYGLGLIFATQAPKGLHNQIPGNASTQFFGFLNAPVQIAAAKEMAIAKGGDVTGIAQLTKGQFFTASDGVAFQKIRSPLCLTHHPASPLTQEEVVRLAFQSSRTSDRAAYG